MRKLVFLPFLALVLPGVALAEPDPKLDLDLGGESVAFVRIAPGRFVMGSAATEVGRNDDETQHPVVLREGFYMATVPVTVGLWKRFVQATDYRSESEKGTSGGSGWDGQALVQKPIYTWKNPGFPQDDNHPVTLVTYDDALTFAAWATRVSNRFVTLPTEAQWEMAYRAGTTSTYYNPKAKDALALGWFKPNAGQGTKPVRSRPANPWGLYDMAGNVWQWCLDWYAPYPADEVTDPFQGTPDALDKPRRVLRGGSWLKDPKNGRAAARYRNTPGSRNADNGFRLVVLDKPVPVAPAPTSAPPQQEGMTNRPSPLGSPPVEAQSSSSRWFQYVAAIPILGVLFMILAKKFGSSGGSSGIRLQPGKDGYWIHAGSRDVGSRITVNYHSGGRQHVSHANIEHADQGQFVYTGYEPTALTLAAVVPAAQPNRQQGSQGSSWNSSRDDDDDDDSYGSSNSSSSSSSFGGFPSAY